MKPSSRAMALARHARINARSISGQKETTYWSKRKFAHFIGTTFRMDKKQILLIAAWTGIPFSTVRKHVTGETKPGADHVLRYLELFGPELLCAVMGDAPDWVERSLQHEQVRASGIQRNSIDQQIAEYPAG